MIDISNTHHQTYQKSSDYSSYFSYDGGGLRRAKLRLITVPCVRSNNAYHGRGSRAGFIRLGLRDIEDRIKQHKVTFRSGFGLLNRHPTHNTLWRVNEFIRRLSLE